MTKIILLLSICLTIGLSACNHEVAPPQAISPVPSERQLAWHELEQYAFVHFTTNTFTGKEWGYGDESPEIFNPEGFDPEQWVKTLRDAGMKALILTCKHHDGFCLWPSAYTKHSVESSPWMNGKGDVVRAVSDACRKYGLKFGVYLSPWDRNFAGYGTPEYITYYRNQLRELLTNYGDICEVWFDGANGGDGYYGGARESRKIDNKTYYDWPNTHAIVRELAPNAVIFSDAGPDIRWCGNEKGFVGDPNWCTINNDTLYPGQHGINEILNHGNEGGTHWVPAEVDVSIRSGWFYHAHEDDKVRTPENLFQLYLESVGRGANFLLNIPPDQRGLFHERDVKALLEWKTMKDAAFAKNLAEGAKVTASSYRGKSTEYAPGNVLMDKENYWATDDQITNGHLELEFGQVQTISYVALQEFIKLGQRVKSFSIDTYDGKTWVPAASGTTVGYKRIVKLDTPVQAKKIRITINDARACPLISNVAVY